MGFGGQMSSHAVVWMVAGASDLTLAHVTEASATAANVLKTSSDRFIFLPQTLQGLPSRSE